MASFYDELASRYHLIFDDWDASMRRQGKMLAEIIRALWPGASRVLDVSCGIGTQAIALALNGFQVKASDIAPRAVERAKEEARQRGLDLAFSVADMRDAFTTHGGDFDVVISCDNSIPHLLTDAEILVALRQMFACLRPGGGCVITVRDYEREPRGTNIVKPISAITRGAMRHVAFQVWDFDGDCYDLTMFIVEENLSTGAVATQAMRSRYYAIGITKLMALMDEAGFRHTARLDGAFHQPVLLGTKPA
jgi:SAM-dependent methyltransferase